MISSMKKNSAFFLAPIAAMFIIAAVFQGPLLVKHLDSLTSVGQAFLEFTKCLITLGPATVIAIIIGFPVFYLLRWIIHWKLWSCLLGALLVVGSVSLLMERIAGKDIMEIISGQYLPAIMLATVSYGTVFWFLMTRYQDEDEEE